MDFVLQGKKALADKNPRLAVELFTRALIQHPTSPHFYTQRAIAFARLKPEDGGPDYLASLKNSKFAEHLAEQRGSRELILAAQMRSAIALFHMGYYADTKALLERIETWVNKKNENVRGEQKGTDKLFAKHDSIMMELPIWKAKTAKKLEGLSEEELNKSFELQGSKYSPDEKSLKAELEAWLSGQSQQISEPATTTAEPATTTVEPATSTATSTATQKAPITSTETRLAEKPRYDWYQTATDVNIVVYVKVAEGMKTDNNWTENEESKVHLVWEVPSGDRNSFTLAPFYAPVDDKETRFRWVKGQKVEISMKKKQPNVKWRTLLAPLPQQGPGETAAAPTTASNTAKQYDEIDSDDNEGGDPMDSFFKNMFAKADPDTRRAMMKSFIESNGTALSTNWSDVGSRTVEEYRST